MLFLQPLLEPKGEKRSEEKQHLDVTRAKLPRWWTDDAAGGPTLPVSANPWNSARTPACAASPAAPGSGPPGTAFPLQELWRQGRGQRSAEG